MTIWGYGDYGSEPGTMTAWGYPQDGVGVLVLIFAETFGISDAINLDFIGAFVLNLAETFGISDDIELVIPSWLRKVHIGDDVYRIVIKRIR